MNCFPDDETAGARGVLVRLALIVGAILLVARPTTGSPSLDPYNVVWNSPSQDSSESMPVGGHSIGLNVWVEDGDVLFYAQRTGSFTENNEFHKLGRIRLRLNPNPFAEATQFRQELKLREGYVEISARKDGLEVTVDIWVECLRPVVHMDVRSNRRIVATVSYEGWRNQPLEMASERYGIRFGCFSWDCYPGPVIRYPDAVEHRDNDVLFYHRNRDDKLLFDYMVKQQGLEDVRDELANTQVGRTFGGLLMGKGSVPAGNRSGKYIQAAYKAWDLKSAKPRKNHTVKLYTHVAQTKTLEDWKAGLRELAEERKTDRAARRETLAWWDAFWNRSWLMINPAAPDPESRAWQVGRNYQLFRYQLGCNAYGEYPTKFNGGNFTFDPSLVSKAGNKRPFKPGPTPDWRSWGGGSFTAQNQRLVYWPLLKTGDFDVMKPQFEFYRRALPSAMARVKAYWGHEGCLFTEQMENFGLPIACAWGWTEPDARERRRGEGVEHGVQVNGAVGYHYESQLEFSYMILEYHRHTGADISAYMDFIKASVTFFDDHYQMRHRKRSGQPLDDNGKLVIFPSTACETYKNARNPSDVVSGLRACLTSLLALPVEYVSEADREYYREFLERVPDFNRGEIGGEPVMKPAESWGHVGNAECPQFYPLFPFNRFELGIDDLAAFRNTWRLDTSFPKNMVWSWHQDGIFFARMGMTKEAVDYNTKKMQDSPRRFPTFWGPGHDWVPDHNWGGSGMIGIQEMLMQTVGEKIRLFPAWPADWDAVFKLHAPYSTVVEGRLVDGEFTLISVSPPERRKDIVNMLHKD